MSTGAGCGANFLLTDAGESRIRASAVVRQVATHSD